jgi:predicted DNA-binding protein
MLDQITVTLPTEILQRAEQLARCTGRSVDQLLAETIELSLRPLGTSSLPEEGMAEWSDEQVLEAADDSGLSTAEDRRLSELLHRQQAGTLSAEERPQLTGLMEVYQTQLLRKARALGEAVRRGLRPPLPPE